MVPRFGAGVTKNNGITLQDVRNEFGRDRWELVRIAPHIDRAQPFDGTIHLPRTGWASGMSQGRLTVSAMRSLPRRRQVTMLRIASVALVIGWALLVAVTIWISVFMFGWTPP